MCDKNTFQMRFVSNIVPNVDNTYKDKKHVYAIKANVKFYENGVCSKNNSFILYDEVHESREAAREFLAKYFRTIGYNGFLDENGKIIDSGHDVWIIEGKPYKVAEDKVVKKSCHEVMLYRIIDLHLTDSCFEAIKNELVAPEHK